MGCSAARRFSVAAQKCHRPHQDARRRKSHGHKDPVGFLGQRFFHATGIDFTGDRKTMRDRRLDTGRSCLKGWRDVRRSHLGDRLGPGQSGYAQAVTNPGGRLPCGTTCRPSPRVAGPSRRPHPEGTRGPAERPAVRTLWPGTVEGRISGIVAHSLPIARRIDPRRVAASERGPSARASKGYGDGKVARIHVATARVMAEAKLTP